MAWTFKPAAKIASCVGFGVGGGGAGVLGVFGAIHLPTAIIPAAVVAGLAVVTRAVVRFAEVRYEHQAAIIDAETAAKDAESAAKVAEIKAKADVEAQALAASAEAEALKAWHEMRHELLRAGLDPDTKDAALEMLRLQNIDVNLPNDRRLPSTALAKLLAPPDPRGVSNKPRRGPGGVVVPIRKDE